VNHDWTVFGVDHADLEQTSGGIGTDEHREPVIEVLDKDRIVNACMMSSSWMPCLRALGATNGASTPTS